MKAAAYIVVWWRIIKICRSKEEN